MLYSQVVMAIFEKTRVLRKATFNLIQIFLVVIFATFQLIQIFLARKVT